MGSGGPLGLQIRWASSKGGVAGFNSQALPPLLPCRGRGRRFRLGGLFLVALALSVGLAVALVAFVGVGRFGHLDHS